VVILDDIGYVQQSREEMEGAYVKVGGGEMTKHRG
jgi:hypothetical protein